MLVDHRSIGFPAEAQVQSERLFTRQSSWANLARYQLDRSSSCVCNCEKPVGNPSSIDASPLPVAAFPGKTGRQCAEPERARDGLKIELVIPRPPGFEAELKSVSADDFRDVVDDLLLLDRKLLPLLRIRPESRETLPGRTAETRYRERPSSRSLRDSRRPARR